jgi:hypothetical protein
MKPYVELRTVPLTLKQANALVKRLHRHHEPVNAHRFSIGALSGNVLVGCAIVGRPVSYHYEQYKVCEVSRLATDGSANACSFLYGACAKTAKIMGFERIQTYTLPDESGKSLRGAGWIDEGIRRSAAWTQRGKGVRRNKHPIGPKRLWSKRLADPWPDNFNLDVYAASVLTYDSTLCLTCSATLDRTKIMAVTYQFTTDDVNVALEIVKLMGGGTAATATHKMPAAPGAQVGTQPPAPPRPATPLQAAPPAPAPAAPPAYAPPVAAPPVAAPPSGTAHDDHDKQTLASGWTLDMVKEAASAYVQRNPAGAQGVAQILQAHGANRMPELAPKHYPAVHQALSA